MDERDMEQEGQNGKRKGLGIERKMIFFGIDIFILDKTVTRNTKARFLFIVQHYLQHFFLFDKFNCCGLTIQ
jgi:hypothetical protein